MNDFSKNPWLAMKPRGGFAGVFLRFVALGETLFVLLGLIVLARFLFGAAGFAGSDEFLFAEDGAPDFRAAAIAESQWHMMRYGLVFLAIMIIGIIRGRRNRESYALTMGGHSLTSLIVFGVGVFTVMHIPSLTLRLVDNVVDIGPGTPFWDLMNDVEWDKDFWLFMAVSSFLVVPLVEETVARGYMLGRFREAFSPGAALVVMALIFAAAHTQYHQANIYALGNLFALVWGSTLMGYAVYRTGSLIPPIIAHALVNIPTSLEADYAVAGVIVLTLFAFRKAYAENARRLGAILVGINDWFSLLIIGAVIVAFGVTLQAAPWAPYAWLAGFLGLFIASLFVKSRWR